MDEDNLEVNRLAICRGRRENDGTPCRSAVVLKNGYCSAHQDQASNPWKRFRLWGKYLLNRYWLLAVAVAVAGLVVYAVQAYNALTGDPALGPFFRFFRRGELAPDEYLDSFELVIFLPGDKVNAATGMADYEAIAYALCAGHADCDVTVEAQFLSPRFPFRETVYFTSGLRDVRVYIVPYDSQQWDRPPTWYSYTIGFHEKPRHPVTINLSQSGQYELSIQANQRDLAQLGTPVTIRAIEGWDVALELTWTGPTAEWVYSMMREGSAMEWVRDLGAVVKINGVAVWNGMLSEGSSLVVHPIPLQVDGEDAVRWRFTKAYGTNPRPGSAEQ